MNVLYKAGEVGYVLRRLRRPAAGHLGGFARRGGQGRRRRGRATSCTSWRAPGMPACRRRAGRSSSCWRPRPAAPPLHQTDPGDIAVIVYTAGTTGRPKGAELTHFQLFMNADTPGPAVRRPRRRRRPGRPAAVPRLRAVQHPRRLRALRRDDVAGPALRRRPRCSRSIQRDRVTVFEGVPTMYIAVLNHPDLDDYDLSSLRVGVSGGAPIPAEVLDAFERTLRRRHPRGLRAVRDRRRRRRSTSAPTSAGSTASASRSGASRSQIWDDDGHVAAARPGARRRARRPRAST